MTCPKGIYLQSQTLFKASWYQNKLTLVGLHQKFPSCLCIADTYMSFICWLDRIAELPKCIVLKPGMPEVWRIKLRSVMESCLFIEMKLERVTFANFQRQATLAKQSSRPSVEFVNQLGLNKEQDQWSLKCICVIPVDSETVLGRGYAHRQVWPTAEICMFPLWFPHRKQEISNLQKAVWQACVQ